MNQNDLAIGWALSSSPLLRNLKSERDYLVRSRNRQLSEIDQRIRDTECSLIGNRAIEHTEPQP